MNDQSERQVLETLLARVRKRLFLKAFYNFSLQAALVLLPLAAIAVAILQRWQQGQRTITVVASAVAIIVGTALLRSLLGLGEQVRSALTLDEQAHLKDRVSSAYEFLKEGRELDEVRRLQVQDAIHHARKIDANAVFKFKAPGWSRIVPVMAALLIISFLVPPLQVQVNAISAADPVKVAQLEELKELEKELAEKEQTPEVEEVLKQLEEMRKRFERGEIGERDVMLQLARMDESLREKAKQLGVENMEGEMNAVLPHLMSAQAMAMAAQAIKEKDFDKAVQELEKLEEKVKQDELTEEQKRQLAMNLGLAASKLGGKSKSALAGDLSQASECLEKSNKEGFCSASKSLGNKLQMMKKRQLMASACNKLGLCKGSLGQCSSKELGYKLGPKSQSKGKGGLKAGTGASGDPFGERDRLASSYKKMLQVQGQAGEGPVESETEITEGQLSQSQLNLKEVHANFEAVAEEAIEKESIPLSHRYHVKKYFQAIRPQE